MQKKVGCRQLMWILGFFTVIAFMTRGSIPVKAYTEELKTNSGIVYPISLVTGKDAKGKVVFPDTAFLTYIRQATFLSGTYSGYSFDLDDDNYLSKEECETVRIIYVTGKEDIYDLSGVEAFPKLRELRCGGTNVKKLDLRNNPRLKELSAYNTPLQELDVTECSLLQSLDVRNANLTSLNLQQNEALDTVMLQGQSRDGYEFMDGEMYRILLTDYDKTLDTKQISEVEIDGAPGDDIHSGYEAEQASIYCTDEMREISYRYYTGNANVKQMPVTIHISTAYRQAYDTQGGEKVLAQYFVAGMPDVAPEIPKRLGYHFDGWYLTASVEEPYIFGRQINKNNTLYAKWRKHEYEVIYDANGGKMMLPKHEGRVDYWTTNLLPTGLQKPTKTGFVLAGWETESGVFITEANQSQVSYGQAAISDEADSMTLKARWTSNTGYRLRFSTNLTATKSKNITWMPEAVVSGLTWDSKEYMDFSIEPELAGYCFNGWYTDKENGVKITPQMTYGQIYAYQFKGESVSNIPTLYARFSKRRLTICYDVKGGSAVPNRTNLIWGSSNLLPKKKTKKKNYIFVGWLCDGKYVTKKTKMSDISSGFDDTLTLSAVWVKKYEKKGTTFTRYGLTYKVTKSDKKGQHIRLIKVKKGKKKVILRQRIFYNGKFFKLTSIQKGTLQKVKKISLKVPKKQKKKYKKMIRKSGKKI